MDYSRAKASTPDSVALLSGYPLLLIVLLVVNDVCHSNHFLLNTFYFKVGA
jgi:hypothetical protein